MKFSTAFIALLFAAASAETGRTEENPRSRADTEITGRVEESRTLLHRSPRNAFYYVRLKVKVESVEKGRERIRGAEIIEVRCWHKAFGGPDSPVGHHPLPADGARFRAWLTQKKEGYFEAIEPNGFELLDGSAPRVFPVLQQRTVGLGQILAGIVGLLLICAAAFFRYRGNGSKERNWRIQTAESSARDTEAGDPGSKNNRD